MDVGRLGRHLDVDLGYSSVAVPDVLRDGRVEQVGLLADHGDVVVEVLDVHRAQVVVADSDGACGGFVEALEERGDGGFSGSGGANDRDALASGDLEADVLENRGIGSLWVSELDMVEVDRTRKSRLEDTTRLIGIGVELVEVASCLNGPCDLVGWTKVSWELIPQLKKQRE